MKRLLTTLIFLAFIVSTAFAQEDRGVVIEAQESQGRKIAVLIGVNDYAHIDPLRYTKNDVEALRDQLLAVGFEQKNVVTLTSGESKNRPTKHNIETVIGGMLNLAKEGDIVLIHLSGHGIEFGGEARFCPEEARADDLVSTTISIKDIYGVMERSKATFKLMIVDACRNNPFTGRNVEARALRTLDDPPKGVLLLQSCAKDELSYEDNEFKRGIFTHFLIEGLKGEAANKNGNVTFYSLVDYVSEETQRRVLEKHRTRQTPYSLGEGANFVLASISALPVPSQPADSPSVPAPVSTESQFTAAEQDGINRFFKSSGIDVEKVNGEDLHKYDIGYLTRFTNNAAVVRYFISHGAEVNAKNNSGETLLLRAIIWGFKSDGQRSEVDANGNRVWKHIFDENKVRCSFDIVQLLVSHGAEVNVKDQRKQTPPLHLVAQSRYADNVGYVKYLVEHGADIHAKDNSGRTPLFDVVNLEVAKFLVEQGAEVNVKDNSNETPLHLIARSRYADNVEYVKFLVEQGADIHAKNNRSVLPHGEANNVEIVQYLVTQMVADFDAKDVSAETLINIDYQVAKYLVSLQLETDKNAKGIYDKSSLFQYAQGLADLNVDGSLDLFLRLISQVRNAPSALLFGVKRVEIAQVLVEKGADVHSKNGEGRTPLFYAANAEIAGLFIARGADINMTDKYGATPLHLAASNGNVEVAKFLVSKWANLNVPLPATNNFGHKGATALSIAKNKGNQEMIKYLESVGAK